MGAAAAQTARDLGGEIIVMDIADVDYEAAQTIKVDLSDLDSINAALGQVDGPIHAIFSCAGIADGPPLMKINFISQRHIIDTLVADGRLGSGGAAAMISSTAGLAWQNQLDTALDFLSKSDWDSMNAWIDAAPENNHYGFSKVAMNTYVAHEALPLLKKGIRLNAIMPGPTDTPLARANADTWLTFGQAYRDEAGTETLKPHEMGDTLVFLCSDAASGITGEIVVVDQGQAGSAITGSYDDKMMLALMGKIDIAELMAQMEPPAE